MPNSVEDFESSESANSKDERVRHFQKRFDEAKEFRKSKENGWNEAENFYDGKHWKDNPSRNKYVENLVFKTVETIVPVLTDSRPATDVIPYQNEDSETAKILEGSLKFVYEANDLQLKLATSVREALKTGTHWLYVDWDPDKENGEGQVTITSKNWRQVYVDPGPHDIEEASYVIVEGVFTRSDLVRRFGDKAKNIEPEDLVGDSHGNIREAGKREKFWSGPDSGDNDEDKRFRLNDRVRVYELWEKDYSLENIPISETVDEIDREFEEFLNGENPDVGKWEDHEAHIENHERQRTNLEAQITLRVGQALQILPEEVTEGDLGAAMEDPALAEEIQGLRLAMDMIGDHLEMHKALLKENPDSKKPKYPNNLRLSIISQGEVLYDGRPPVGDGMIPLVPVYAYKDDSSVYGIGEIKNLVGPQKSYNEVSYRELKHLQTSAGRVIIDEQSGLDEDDIHNKPNAVHKVKNQGRFDVISPPPVSSIYQSRKAADADMIRSISGVTEQTEGNKGSGVLADRTYHSMLTQAVGRMRLKGRYLEEYSLVRLGKLVCSRIIQHWSVERKLRVYDANGEIQFVHFRPEDMKHFKYDVKMVPGSTAGLNKRDILQEMKELLLAGAITFDDFLETTDLPGKTHLLKKHKERNDLGAQMEALARENEELREAVSQAGLGEVLPGPGVA